MKLSMNKQTALRGSLFLLMATQISWPGSTDLRHFTQDLSSEMMLEAGGSAEASNDDNSAEAAPKSEASNKQAPRPQQVIRAYSKDICGQPMTITYREKIGAERDLTTEIRVEPRFMNEKGEAIAVYVLRGGFDINFSDVKVRNENDDFLVKAVEKKLGDNCAKKSVTETIVKIEPAVPTRPTKESKADSSAEEKKKLEAAIKSCRRNSQGELLSDIEKARCHLNSLSDLDVDSDRFGAKSSAAMKIESIVKGDLRRVIKNRLKSHDESDHEEGEELLEETIEEVKDLADSLDLDPRRTERMVRGLESLRDGGETYRRSQLLAEETRESKTQIDAELNAALAAVRQNPNDFSARQQLLELQRNQLQLHAQLQSQMQSEIINGPYQKMLMAQRMGILSPMEMNEFTQPLGMLRQDLMSMIDINRGGLNSGFDRGLNNGMQSQFNPLNPGMPPSQSLPTDFMTYRSGLNQGANRLARPQFSQPLSAQDPTFNNSGASGLPTGKPFMGGGRF